jgi:hypothetical protein
LNKGRPEEKRASPEGALTLSGSVSAFVSIKSTLFPYVSDIGRRNCKSGASGVAKATRGLKPAPQGLLHEGFIEDRNVII